MRRLTIETELPGDVSLREAGIVLTSGGLVAFPTETFYALGADPRNERAVISLFEAKGRGKNNAIPLVAASVEQLVGEGASLSPLARRLARAFWPGPLTLVIPAWGGLAKLIHGGLETVAVRVPGNATARGLAAAFGHPVTSTSANLSGQAALVEADAVAVAIGASLDLLLDGGITSGGQPSTIADVTGARPRLVREGRVAWARVLECAG